MHIFSLSLSGKHLSCGKNELGNTFCGFTLFVCEKEEIFKNRLRLGVAVLFLEYIFVSG